MTVNTVNGKEKMRQIMQESFEIKPDILFVEEGLRCTFVVEKEAYQSPSYLDAIKSV